MTEPKPGVKTVAELATRAAIEEARAQGHVIDGLQTSLLPTTAVETLTTASGVREPGRPKHSRNKRTLALIKYMETRWRNPLFGLAETRSRPVGVLAKELGCTLLEAKQLQQACEIAELPYWNQKLPQAVELEISDQTGDQRTDDQIRTRILQLAKEAGLPLNLINVTPTKTEEKQ